MRHALAILFFLAQFGTAFAGDPITLYSVSVHGPVQAQADSNGYLKTVANPPANNTGTLTQTTGSCTTTSGTILAANTVTTSVTFWMLATDANGVWLRFDGGTAAASKPSFYIGPGGPMSITFTAVGGLLPTSAVTCYTTSAISVGEIYK